MTLLLSQALSWATRQHPNPQVSYLFPALPPQLCLPYSAFKEEALIYLALEMNFRKRITTLSQERRGESRPWEREAVRVSRLAI